jgi:hypothetical protein
MIMTVRKHRLLILVTAYFALVGLVFQVAALDHWRPAVFEEVRGIEHTDFHSTHCHGASAGCADGAASASWLNASPAAVPRPPAEREVSRTVFDVAPAETPPLVPFHPPRAA